jgi:mRNA interferase MazF
VKNFDSWNTDKKHIDSNVNYLPLYRERQVRWCRLGINIGFEQDGTGKEFSRPVLILKGFSRRTCLIVPLTTSDKKSKYLIPIGFINNKKAQIIISQIRLIDTRRLDKHIATLDKRSFCKIKETIRGFL